MVVRKHPSYFLVISEVQDALNDIDGMAFSIDRFRINIPKERLPEFR